MFYYAYIIYPSRKVISDGPYDTKLTAGTELLKSKRSHSPDRNIIEDMTIVDSESKFNKLLERLRVKALKRDLKNLKNENKIIRVAADKELKLAEKWDLHKDSKVKVKRFRSDNNFSDSDIISYMILTRDLKTYQYDCPVDENIRDSIKNIKDRYLNVVKIKRIKDLSNIEHERSDFIRSYKINREKHDNKYDSRGMPITYKFRRGSLMRNNIKEIKNTQYSIKDTVNNVKSKFKTSAINHGIIKTMDKNMENLKNRGNKKYYKDGVYVGPTTEVNNMTEVRLYSYTPPPPPQRYDPNQPNPYFPKVDDEDSKPNSPDKLIGMELHASKGNKLSKDAGEGYSTRREKYDTLKNKVSNERWKL